MIAHNIEPKSFQQHGRVEVSVVEEGIEITSLITINDHFNRFTEPIKHYVYYPEKYKLPLKIDLTVRIDAPTLYILFGKGHISFNSIWSDNRRISDIAAPDLKPYNFNNEIPINEDVDISILYGTNFMQIMINGEERYYTKKSAYMKNNLIKEINEEGLALRLMCSKRTKLLIKNITITEYETGEDFVNPHKDNDYEPLLLSVDKSVKSDFETCISCLSKDLQDKLMEVDTYLRSHKKLGIKRKIEGSYKACRITYLSGMGFSYILIINKHSMVHYFWWYTVSNYKYENKYLGRKNDLTEQTLKRIGEESPELAKTLFDLYISCYSCNPRCTARTLYEFEGEKRMTCHGKLLFKMDPDDFDYVIRLMEVMEELGGSE